ncbi:MULTISPECIES: hypothetical protein [Asticcacaulis]|uniref:hypothetical protein n=1 Tax=Asticcacaulis TaxID=76890 RepID=UPI001AE5C865|nr:MULTISPECIES: hypothetical protein [Asticcacaulis]MBP2160759.1 hypothetical protein [Asticcacaulis solisilvae]MDR6801804.1 hypothetical protein [Asticcacaulis sp. BE141]
MDPITAFVVRIFSTPGVALWLAGGILAFATGLIVRGGWLGYRPLRAALNDRWNKLSALNVHYLDDTQFLEVDRVFSSTDVPELTEGWVRYRSLLTLQPDRRYATSIHAAEAFDHLDEPARTLEWWANILVAAGLVVTFLGIVAALSEATATIGQGAVAEGALLGLLAVAATKFWTSIAGVAGSILLRITARNWRRRTELGARLLFAQLDAAVVFLPPEKALLEQLSALNRIETALKARAS